MILVFRVTLFAEPPIRLDALKQFSGDYWCMVAIGAIFTLARFSEAGNDQDPFGNQSRSAIHRL